MTACDACLRRTDLIASMGAWLDVEWRRRSAPAGVLSLPDETLVALDASDRTAARYERFRAEDARRAIGTARLSAFCRCDPGYPERLRDLTDPPAVLTWRDVPKRSKHRTPSRSSVPAVARATASRWRGRSAVG
jgi:DNA processing protein